MAVQATIRDFLPVTPVHQTEPWHPSRGVFVRPAEHMLPLARSRPLWRRAASHGGLLVAAVFPALLESAYPTPERQRRRSPEPQREALRMVLSTPALDELVDLMRSHQVHGDPVDVASLVLTIYRERHPVTDEQGLQLWVEQLAIDTLHARAKS